MSVKGYVELPNGDLVELVAETEKDLAKQIDSYLRDEFPEE